MGNLIAMVYSRKNFLQEDKTIIRTRFCCLAIPLITILSAAYAGQQLRVLVDQVGYETRSPKQALVMGTAQDHPQEFSLVDSTTGKAVLTGALTPAGQVHAWNGTYWIADFSSWQTPGHYLLKTRTDTGEASSCSFAIEEDLLERRHAFERCLLLQRPALKRTDRSGRPPSAASRRQPGFVDVHGGWYDATGDYGIHLSHQNPTSYFNPQQVPLVAWTCSKATGSRGAA